MADRFRPFLRWVLVGLAAGQLLTVDPDSDGSLGFAVGVWMSCAVVAVFDVGFVLVDRWKARRASSSCGSCVRCVERDDPSPWRVMIVCVRCGNKRCPHATDHRLPCTGSNEPGQPGSVY